MESVSVTDSLEIQPQAQPKPKLGVPDQAWIESKAGYLELTKRQSGKEYSTMMSFPTMTAQTIGTPELESREGVAFIVQRLTWRASFSRYGGSVQRSYQGWPDYTYISLPYPHNRKVKTMDKFVIKTESGEATYYKVWTDDPYQGIGNNWGGAYNLPVFARWDSSGTIKPKTQRRKRGA